MRIHRIAVCSLLGEGGAGAHTESIVLVLTAYSILLKDFSGHARHDGNIWSVTFEMDWLSGSESK